MAPRLQNYNRLSLTDRQNSYLSPTQELFESGVEGNKVLARLNNDSRQPCIRNIVGSRFLLYAKLPQQRQFTTD